MVDTVFDVVAAGMVPMAIFELHDMLDSDRERALRDWTNAEVVDVLAGSGDNILFGAVPNASKVMHRLAGEQLAVLAKAVAAAAFRAGGVRLFGTLWCAEHAPVGISAERCEGCVAVPPGPLPGGDELRARRVKAGWSQREVARRLGVSQGLVCRMDAGAASVNERARQAYAALLDEIAPMPAAGGSDG